MAGVHHDFARIAEANGIEFVVDEPLPWLTRRGHLEPIVQEQAPAEVLAVLEQIFVELGGDLIKLERNRGGNPSAPDLRHTQLGCLLELDELPHFTPARRASLARYPVGAPLGFDPAEYLALIEQHGEAAQAIFAREHTKEFPRPGGRVAQRAYLDALRDLLAPTFTGHPALRVPVPDGSLRGVLDTARALLATITPG